MSESLGNRDLILASALRLFAERGYEAVGVAEICESTQVTKPTLYHYFGSKRGLLDAIVAERGGPLLERARKVAPDPADVPYGLERLLFALAASAKEDPDFARLRLCLAFAPPKSEGGEAAAAFNQSIYELAEAYFAAAARHHGNMKGRSRAYAVSFLGIADSYIGLFLAGHIALSETVLRGAVRQFMYGIFS